MWTLALLVVSIAPPSGEAPYRQPSVAAGRSMAGVAFGAENRIYFSRMDGGTPVMVFSGGKMALGRRRGPKLAFAGDTAVITAIVGEKGGGADGDLQSWRSADGGRTWLGPIKISDVPGAAREGMHGIGANGSIVAVVWLDLRDKHTKLYSSVSKDSGATWSPNRLVYESPSGTICECCHPSVAVAKDGSVTAMFRNSLEGNRDMYLVQEGAAKPVKLGTGTWKLNACPMDGGGLSFDTEGQPVTAWRRETQVYLTSASGKEVLVGNGKDPALAVGRKGPYVAFSQGGELKLRRPDEAISTLDPSGAWVSLATRPDGKVVAAWESGGAIRVETLPE